MGKPSALTLREAVDRLSREFPEYEFYKVFGGG